ncbi:hypothetical protein HYZ64_03590 [Candidatus Berkelbacteria bacterium]|nr:hypothetical protein [Candidatus Berkelbacteria bacterium]
MMLLNALLYALLLLFTLRPTRDKKISEISAAEAAKRAKRLLREALSPEQYKQLRGEGIVVASRVSGYQYLVGSQGYVILISDENTRTSLCVAPVHHLPVSDRVLTMIRHLQADEYGLVKKAGFGGRPDLRPHLLKELKRARRPT